MTIIWGILVGLAADTFTHHLIFAAIWGLVGCLRLAWHIGVHRSKWMRVPVELTMPMPPLSVWLIQFGMDAVQCLALSSLIALIRWWF